MIPVKAFRLLPLLLTVGCASTGPINPPPTPTSAHPVQVTLHRVESPVGAPLPMVFRIDDTDIYGLGNGESYSFALDPGEYLFGWRFGMNDCAQAVWLHRGRNVRIDLSDLCNIPPVP